MIYIRTRAKRSSTNPIWTLIDDARYIDPGELSARTHLSKRYTVRIESNNGYTLSDQVTSLVLSARLFRNTDGADITDLAKKHGVCPEWKWSVADNTMAVSGDAWSVTLVPKNVLRPARMECRIDEAAIDVRLWLNNVLLQLSQQAPQQFGYDRIYARAECDITNEARLIHSFVLSPNLIPTLISNSEFCEAVKGDKGDRGEEGPRGATGPKGDAGLTPTLSLNDKYQLLADGVLLSQQSLKGQDAGRYLGRAKRIHPDFNGNYLSETESSWRTAQEGDYVYLVGDLSNRGGDKDTYYIVREHKNNTVWEVYNIKGSTPTLKLDKNFRLLADGVLVSDYSLKGARGEDASPSDVAELIASDEGNLYRAVINRDPIHRIGLTDANLRENYQRHKVYMLGKSETVNLSTLTNGLPEGARLSIIRELYEPPKTQSSTATSDFAGGGKIIVDTPTIKPPQNPQGGSGGLTGGDIPTYTLGFSIDLKFGAKEHKPRTVEIVMQRVCQTDGSCKVMPVVISDDVMHADLADRIDTERRRIDTERRRIDTEHQRINDMQALLRTKYVQRNLISLNNQPSTSISLNSDMSTVIVRRGRGSSTRYLRVEDLKDAPIGTQITIYHFARETDVRAIIPFPSSSYGYAGFISSWGAPDSASVTTQPGYKYELIKTWNPLEFHIARFKME